MNGVRRKVLYLLVLGKIPISLGGVNFIFAVLSKIVIFEDIPLKSFVILIYENPVLTWIAGIKNIRIFSIRIHSATKL